MGATLIDRPSTALTQADIATAGDLRYTRVAYMQGFLFGLIMSTAGSSATLSVAAGNAVDSAGTAMMHLASAMAKTTAAWAAGTTNGGLDTGAIAINTWYHWFLIMNPTTGAVDVVFSATATPAAGPTTLPSGFTLFRRIGAMKTNGSSQWTSFTQYNDDIFWGASVSESTTIPTTTDTLYTLTSVPTGIRVQPFLTANVGLSASGAMGVHIRSPDLQPTEATNGAAGVAAPMTAAVDTTAGRIARTLNDPTYTNLSAQVNIVASATGTFFRLVGHGWKDDRGKLS